MGTALRQCATFIIVTVHSDLVIFVVHCILLVDSTSESINIYMYIRLCYIKTPKLLRNNHVTCPFLTVHV